MPPSVFVELCFTAPVAPKTFCFMNDMSYRSDVLQHNPLDFIETDLIPSSIIQLRRPGTLMRRDRLGVLHGAPIFEVGRDPRRPERVAAG